ncbi:MAG: hypothetical protein ACTHOK_07745, partial [Nocardioidaceae bacterium]
AGARGGGRGGVRRGGSAVRGGPGGPAPAPQPRAWRDATLISNSTIVATAEEVRAIGRRIQELLAPYVVTKRDNPPADARPVHTAVRLAPAPQRPAAS